MSAALKPRASLDPAARRPDLENVVNYTIVALLGMLAGLLVGYTMGFGARDVTNQAVPVPHPRSLTTPGR